MSTEIAATPSREEVIRALDDVHDPELHRSIVALGMVGAVEASPGGRVSVAIKLTIAGCPLKAEIQKRVTDAVIGLHGVTGVHVTMDAMTDEEVKRLASEDMAELGIDPDWMEHTTVMFPRPKERVTVRLDPDVLDWLKAQGKGYQTRINAILRAYYEAHQGKSGGVSPTTRG